jgi:peptide/nickel transport system substrate-binding protein
MIKKNRALTVVLLAAVTLALALGCAATAGADSADQPEKTVLRVGWMTDPDNLNPFIGYNGSSQEIYTCNYDFLTQIDPATLQPRPGLATSWTQSDDGTVWTFALREGVKWHDGVPFTAKDVAFTYNYIIEEELGNYTPFTTFIEGVEVVDDYTVRFVCSQPKANMLSLVIPIVPEHIWGKVPGEKVQSTYANEPPIVGTGPFQVIEAKKGQYVKLKANKDYWGGAPKIDELIFETFQNPQTQAEQLKLGKLAVATELPPAAYQKLTTTPGLTCCDANPYRDVNTIGFNCYTGKASKGHPVLLDPAFRRALNYAIDKEAIAETAFQGHALPASSVIVSDYYTEPDWHWQPSPEAEYEFDLDGARAALDEAGYRDTDGDGIREYDGKPIELRFWALDTPAERAVEGRMVTGWLTDIGLKIDYQVVNDGTLVDHMWYYEGDTFAPDYDVFGWGWAGDVDPTFILSVFTTSQIESWSDTNWSSSEYDRLFEQQATALDPAERQQHIWRMQELMYQDSSMIFVVYPGTCCAWDTTNWTGWVRSPAKTGQVAGLQYIVDSYRLVHPKASADTDSSTGMVVAIIVIAVVVLGGAALAVWLVKRRRSRQAEEV